MVHDKWQKQPASESMKSMDDPTVHIACTFFTCQCHFCEFVSSRRWCDDEWITGGHKENEFVHYFQMLHQFMLNFHTPQSGHNDHQCGNATYHNSLIYIQSNLFPCYKESYKEYFFKIMPNMTLMTKRLCKWFTKHRCCRLPSVLQTELFLLNSGLQFPPSGCSKWQFYVSLLCCLLLLVEIALWRSSRRGHLTRSLAVVLSECIWVSGKVIYHLVHNNNLQR